MEDAKRRAAIRNKAAKNKEMDEGRPSAKRPMLKGDRAPKKQKVSTEPVIGLMAEGKKMMTPAKPGGGKRLMVPPPGSQKKPPVLLREDPKYALGKLSSIIDSENYEDLGNHSTEAMGETGLFSIAQVRARRYYYYIYIFFLTITKTPFRRQAMLMTKALMDRSLHHEMALERVREKAKLAKKELFELKNWKVVTEQKLKLAERARDEYQKMTEELKKTLEDKENDVRRAKEKAVQEYRDSDALISELGVCYTDGFDDALRQAKALYPKLDFSIVNITVAEATSVHPDLSDDTNELFAEEVPGSIVPEIQPEEEKTRAAKDPIIPDV